MISLNNDYFTKDGLMFFFSTLLLILNTLILLFNLYLHDTRFNFPYFELALPYTPNNYIVHFISFLFFSFSIFIYYYLFKKFSPRYRAYISNKVIKKIRKDKDNYNNAQRLSYLRTIDPFVFEEILLSLFQERGFKIKRNKKYTGDGGSDGVIWFNGHKTHIQAKRYKAYINKAHIIKLHQLTLKSKSKGIFIHTGKTGKGSLGSAQELGIDIVSGDKLIQFLLGENIYIFNTLTQVNCKIKNK